MFGRCTSENYTHLEAERRVKSARDVVHKLRKIALQ